MGLIAFSTLPCIIALSTTYWAQADVTISGASSKTEALSHLGLRYACSQVEQDGQFQERKCERMLAKGVQMKSQEAGELTYVTMIVAAALGAVTFVGQEVVTLRAQSTISTLIFAVSVLHCAATVVAWSLYAGIFFDSKQADQVVFGSETTSYTPSFSFYLAVLATLVSFAVVILDMRLISTPNGETVAPNDIESSDGKADADDEDEDLSSSLDD